MSQINQAQDWAALYGLVKDLGAREFVLAVLGTFVGAFVAFKLSTKQQKEDLLYSEISAINKAAAVVISYLISAQKFYDEKYLPKRTEFLKFRAVVLSALDESELTGNQGTVDLGMIEHLVAPVASPKHPENSAFEYVTALRFLGGRPIVFSHELETALANLKDVVGNYNQYALYAFELGKNPERPHMVHFLAGVPDQYGGSDDRYSSSLDNIGDTLDAILFFGWHILFSLEEYRMLWKKRYPKRELPFVTLGARMENADHWEILEAKFKEYLKLETIFTVPAP